LKAFEQAEAEDDPNQRQDFLTFVLVGAGPTGVELASLLAVLVRTSLRAEFRLINLAATRVVLVDMAPRVLGYFRFRTLRGGQGPGGKSWSGSAVGHSVDRIDADGAVIGGKRIASKVVIWTAGVAPSPAGKWLNVETDCAGRVRIQNDLTVPGHPDIYVVGDTASLQQARNHCRVSPKWRFNNVGMQVGVSLKACLENLPPGRFDISIKGISRLSERGSQSFKPGGSG